ncbi:MAG: F0F1 ATP synthase subunit epsilon [bacterium]
MAELTVKIITPEKVIYEDTASAVYAKSAEGEFGVLKGHISYMTALDVGVAKIEKGKEVEYVAVMGGVFQVADDHITILSDKAELGEDIDVTRAKSAKERAEARLKSAEGTDIDRAQFALIKALTRIKAASRHGA